MLDLDAQSTSPRLHLATNGLITVTPSLGERLYVFVLFIVFIIFPAPVLLAQWHKVQGASYITATAQLLSSCDRELFVYAYHCPFYNAAFLCRCIIFIHSFTPSSLVAWVKRPIHRLAYIPQTPSHLLFRPIPPGTPPVARIGRILSSGIGTVPPFSVCFFVSLFLSIVRKW